MPVPLRCDFDSGQLRRFARRTKDGPQARRLLALAAIYDGATRTQAAAIGGVTLQIVRDWVVKFNARGPDGLIDRKAPGQPSRLNDTHRAALATMIESGPMPAVHGVVRWRLIDLCQWLFEEFRITVAKQTLSRELRGMGYRKLSARPRHHAQAEGAVEDFKKLPGAPGRDRAGEGRRCRPDRGLVRGRGAHRPEEQDHTAVGPAGNAALGAIRSAHGLDLHLRRHLPERGQGSCPGPAGLQHRSHEPAPGRDRNRGGAGSPCRAPHRPGRMAPREPARRAAEHHPRGPPTQVPRANPVENVWQFMRDNWLSNRIFTSYHDLLDHCCDAWNKLTNQPWTIMSIGLRDWAYRS